MYDFQNALDCSIVAFRIQAFYRGIVYNNNKTDIFFEIPEFEQRESNPGPLKKKL